MYTTVQNILVTFVTLKLYNVRIRWSGPFDANVCVWQVTCLQDFFHEESVFIAYGNEKFSVDDFDLGQNGTECYHLVFCQRFCYLLSQSHNLSFLHTRWCHFINANALRNHTDCALQRSGSSVPTNPCDRRSASPCSHQKAGRNSWRYQRDTIKQVTWEDFYCIWYQARRSMPHESAWRWRHDSHETFSPR